MFFCFVLIIITLNMYDYNKKFQMWLILHGLQIIDKRTYSIELIKFKNISRFYFNNIFQKLSQKPGNLWMKIIIIILPISIYELNYLWRNLLLDPKIYQFAKSRFILIILFRLYMVFYYLKKSDYFMNEKHYHLSIIIS